MIIVSFKAFQLWLMEAPLPWLFAHWKGQGFWRCHSIFFAKVRKNPLIPVSASNAGVRINAGFSSIPFKTHRTY